jgi:hypothetical protein
MVEAAIEFRISAKEPRLRSHGLVVRLLNRVAARVIVPGRRQLTTGCEVSGDPLDSGSHDYSTGSADVDSPFAGSTAFAFAKCSRKIVEQLGVALRDVEQDPNVAPSPTAERFSGTAVC